MADEQKFLIEMSSTERDALLIVIRTLENKASKGGESGWWKQRVDALRSLFGRITYAHLGDSQLKRTLTELRRHIAGDGPQDRPPGALEAFDAACERVGVPFLEP